MKQNILAMAAMALMTCPLFMSCSNDPEMDAVPPKFKEIVISPERPKMGDKVTATVKFGSAGRSWYKLKYSWVLSRYGQEPQYYVRGESSSLEMKEPSFDIEIPDTLGMYTLRVNMGTIQATSLFPNGSPFGSATLENNSITFTVRE